LKGGWTKSGFQARGRSSRTTLTVFLSQEEYAELRRAVDEANLLNMSLFVFQAIQAGLENDETHWVQRKRTRRVNLHASKEFSEKIRLRARMFQVTQQALLRALLFQYIRSKPWRKAQAEKLEVA
jgi:hypothetical protein